MLEAPDDIYSFAFNPNEPNILAGGCLNGQVVLWDIGRWEDRIKNPRSDHRDKELFIVCLINSTLMLTYNFDFNEIGNILAWFRR